jgi:hypothetical protein
MAAGGAGCEGPGLLAPSQRRSVGVRLKVRRADIEQELWLQEQRGNHRGALATVWKRRTPRNEQMVSAHKRPSD